MITRHIETTSPAETQLIASTIGSQLRGGEVIELVSDVGGGKTTFTQGLAAGAGSVDRVSSPSFTLSNEYHAERLTIYHFDFYRLSEPGIMAQEIAEVLPMPDAVLVVEWAAIVEEILPEPHVTIQITMAGETIRRLSLSVPEKQEYLVKGLSA